MAAAVGPIVGILGSLVGGLIGSSGASAAGKTIANEGQQVGSAINNQTQSGVNGISSATGAGQAGVASATQGGQNTITTGTQNANGLLNQVYLSELGNTQPYQAAGNQGISSLASAMQSGGALAGSFTAPTEAQVQATPGYQFQLHQGTQAIEQSAAANGLLQSGGTLKGLEQYGQGLASTTYQNAYSNALQGYQTNFNNTFNSLSSLAGIGLTSTGMANSAAQNMGNISSANTMNGANETAGMGMQGAENISQTGLAGAEGAGQLGLSGTVAAGNEYMAGAQGYAAGQAGSANAWGNAINGVGSSMGGLLSGLAQPQQTTNYSESNPYVNPYGGSGILPVNAPYGPTLPQGPRN